MAILAAHTADAASAALADEQHARARVVVVGHSHRPSAEVKDHRLWINPGSAGPRRFSLPRVAALLELRPAELVARIYALDDPGRPVLAEARLTSTP